MNDKPTPPTAGTAIERQFSERQRQLLGLLALGKSNKEMAFDLGITEGTVKQHLFALYKKLGVTSRVKAVILSAQLLGQGAASTATEPVSPPSKAPAHSTYSWRLVTALAIQPLTEPESHPAAIAAYDRLMQQLRLQVRQLAALLDAQLLLSPGGGMLVCLGAPLSHLDDPARGLFFARHLAQWLESQTGFDIAIGLGVATAPEVVSDWTAEPLLRAEAFKLAQLLATHCRRGQILASEISCRLAGPLFPYQSLGADQSTPVSARQVPNRQGVDAPALAQRNPLPFMAEVIEKLRRGQAQWISVESWPPSAGVRLMDAMSVHLDAVGLPVHRLRLPTLTDTAQLGQNMFAQIEAFARLRQRADDNELYGAPPEQKHPLAALRILAKRGPYAIHVYGVNSVPRLMEILGPQGRAALSQLPLLITGMRIHEDESAYVAARLLGPDPATATDTRVFRLALTHAPATPNDLDADLLTLIDILSPEARRQVRELAARTDVAVSALGKVADELIASGLFIQSNGKMMCRDEQTKRALTAHLIRES